MPKRLDIKKILIIGSGPIIIGQACEFDYSGVQACKALREEGYKVILINSNPATIMTDPATADVTYIEPITWQTVEKIIAKERPDAILPTMGGQTALNCALDLWRQGVLDKYQVELIGATPEAIDKAEGKSWPMGSIERFAFYDRSEIGVDGKAVTAGWAEDSRHFRLIISAEDGEALGDLAHHRRILTSKHQLSAVRRSHAAHQAGQRQRASGARRGAHLALVAQQLQTALLY